MSKVNKWDTIYATFSWVTECKSNDVLVETQIRNSLKGGRVDSNTLQSREQTKYKYHHFIPTYNSFKLQTQQEKKL
jgi:hypothetical protein